MGENATCSSSSSFASRYWRIVEAPPPIRMSWSRAASRARWNASWTPPVTKWNTVPPCISIGARAWCVRTKTGTWYGGFLPHHPFHESPSFHGPRDAVNMFRPMIHAPRFAIARDAKSSSMPVSPPSFPPIAWNMRVGKIHSWSASPPTPSGSSRRCRGPAPKPSSDTEYAATRSLDMGPPGSRPGCYCPERPRAIRESSSMTPCTDRSPAMRLAWIVVWLFISGCAGSIWVERVRPDAGGKAGQALASDQGVHYFAPAPYVWISTSGAADGGAEGTAAAAKPAGGKPAYSIEIIYLPDPTREYAIRWKSGLTGSIKPKFDLEKGWNLTNFDSEANTGLTGSLSLQGQAEITRALTLRGEPFQPGLYKLVFDESRKMWTLGD